MELRQLRYLLTVADEQSFTRAAEKLFVTQSALSQQIQKLEEQVGDPLLERATRQIRLTPAGEILVRHASRMFGELDAAQSEIRELRGLQRGILRIGVVQTINAMIIPQAVAAFNATYPQVRIQIEELSAGEIERGLQSGELQVGVGFVPTTDPDIEAESLFTEEMILIVGREHPLAECETLEFSDLADVSLTLLPIQFCTRRLIEDFAHKAGVSIQVQIEMNTIGALLSIVQNSTLGTILPRMALSPKNSTELKSVRLINPTPTRIVGTLWLRNGYRCIASRTFAGLLRSQIEHAQTCSSS